MDANQTIPLTQPNHPTMTIEFLFNTFVFAIYTLCLIFGIIFIGLNYYKIRDKYKTNPDIALFLVPFIVNVWSFVYCLVLSRQIFLYWYWPLIDHLDSMSVYLLYWKKTQKCQNLWTYWRYSYRKVHSCQRNEKQSPEIACYWLWLNLNSTKKKGKQRLQSHSKASRWSIQRIHWY